MSQFSEALLAGVGLVAIQWAKVEYELKAHTSALAGKDTGGLPVDDIDVSFKRLRRVWLDQMRKHRPRDAIKAEQMIDTIVPLSNQRAIMVHGHWRTTDKRGKYRVRTARQKRQQVEWEEYEASPALLRKIANEIADAHANLRRLTRGKHGSKHPNRFLV